MMRLGKKSKSTDGDGAVDYEMSNAKSGNAYTTDDTEDAKFGDMDTTAADVACDCCSGGGAEDAKCEKQNAKSDDNNAADVVTEAEDADSGNITDESCGVGSESRAPNSGLEKDLAVERDRYLRLAAEYDNFRKRSAKEREKTYSDARAEAITRLLPVYDNLERALKMECADEAFYKGVEMTMTQLAGIFESMEIKQIKALGEPFDPNRHNAVMTIENPDLGEKIVAEEYQKGFMLGERVIRHSTVVVAN